MVQYGLSVVVQKRDKFERGDKWVNRSARQMCALCNVLRRYDGKLSPGLKALGELPFAAWVQILGAIAVVELTIGKQDYENKVGRLVNLLRKLTSGFGCGTCTSLTRSSKCHVTYYLCPV